MPRRYSLLVALVLTAAACGGSSKAATGSAIPAVKLPATTPTKLLVTDITEGAGPAAKDGDTLFVRYVGVRSANGQRFDENFTTGAPFPVHLGAGGVIAGWDQGLVGVKQGGRRQLDIPADLAYGDHPQGEVIKPGDALSFVVDVVGIAASASLTDKPQVTIPAAANVGAITTTDLVAGSGPEVKTGENVVLQLTTYRADTGAELNSSYTTGQPLVFVLGQQSVIPGLEQTVTGMHVGGRRQVQIPFADAFGEAGRPDLGLPASTDLVVVLDVTNAF
jgi:peptidylprolyl isomerase